MEFSDGDPLAFVIEQNTDAKNIGVTQFYVVVNADFAIPEITLDSVTAANPAPSGIWWGDDVTISGTAGGFSTGDTITVVLGDGNSESIPAASNWDLVYQYSTPNVSGESNTISATLNSGTNELAQSPTTVDVIVIPHTVELIAVPIGTSDFWGTSQDKIVVVR